jgi:hypothetical protein
VAVRKSGLIAHPLERAGLPEPEQLARCELVGDRKRRFWLRLCGVSASDLRLKARSPAVDHP